MKAGSDIQYFKKDEEIPEGARIVSIQFQTRPSDCLKEVVGYWYQVPTENVLRESIKLIKLAIKYEDFDDDGKWVGKATKFVARYE